MKQLQLDLDAYAERERVFTKELGDLKREKEALFNDNERRQWLEDEHAKEIAILSSQEEALNEKLKDLENVVEQMEASKNAEIDTIKGEANTIVKVTCSKTKKF